ncbi:MAG: hypothetical protein KA369_14180 [Spirochaetes bacterium]|nr:hypothetical protein [Spirochaetota bacterium]
MEGQKYGRTALVAFVSSVITLILVVIHETVRYCTGSPIMAIDWAANALMVATSFYIRSHVDVEEYRLAVLGSVPGGRSLNPLRFINGMPAAMTIGFGAAITILYNFIAGMILYFIMQILLIYTFSGIVPLDLRDFNIGESRGYYRTVILIAFLVPVAIFCEVIYNGLQSLVVVPYMLVLSAMAVMTYAALAVAGRPLLFRVAPAAAASFFIASDILVGYVAFNNPLDKYYAAISMTYIIAMVLFNITILFLKNRNGGYILS